jgi:hypothetical protein
LNRLLGPTHLLLARPDFLVDGSSGDFRNSEMLLQTKFKSSEVGVGSKNAFNKTNAVKEIKIL